MLERVSHRAPCYKEYHTGHHVIKGICMTSLQTVLLADQMLLGIKCMFNPLSPHDALRHHFASLKNDLIS